MKYLLLGLVVATTCIAGCGKTTESGCTPATPASERAAMVAYCTANSINFTEHTSGILYEITAAGTGGSPSLSSYVTVFYTLKLMNNVTVQSNTGGTPFSEYLNNLIEGWKISIPFLKAGGKIKVVIPSSLAYSCVGSSGIPANSPLFFEITLVSFR